MLGCSPCRRCFGHGRCIARHRRPGGRCRRKRKLPRARRRLGMWRVASGGGPEVTVVKGDVCTNTPDASQGLLLALLGGGTRARTDAQPKVRFTHKNTSCSGASGVGRAEPLKRAY
eukprot:450514-Prymnesium_polylepis.1